MMTAALASLVGVCLGAMEWRRLKRRVPDTTVETALRDARHVLGVLPLGFGLFVAQVVVVLHPDILWDAPLWLELRYTSLIFGGIGACVSFALGFAAFASLSTRHRSRVPIVVSGLMAIGVVAGVEWDFTAPISSELHERMRGEVVLQSAPSSCAAASAANLARRYGIESTEPQMGALLGTTRFGSSPAQVIHGLERLGLTCRKVVHASADPTSARTPAVLFFPPGGRYRVGHAVLLTRADADTATVFDPLVGEIQIGTKEFPEYWRGHAVECDPPLARAAHSRPSNADHAPGRGGATVRRAGSAVRRTGRVRGSGGE